MFCSYNAAGQAGHASSPEELDAVMHEIGSSKERYEAMVAWKRRQVTPPVEEGSGGAGCPSCQYQPESGEGRPDA